MKHSTFIAIVGTASIVASAEAGFLGFVASVRTVGGNTVIDIYAGVDNPSDKFLNVYNANISTTLAGGFKQKAGLATKTWKPDTAGFSSTRNTIDDSFMTAGTFSGGAYGGEYYASSNTNGDGNFTGTSWNATPASPAATTIPANAGWYTGDPTSVDNRAESLAGLVGRINTSATAASGNTLGSLGTANANFGIWCGHLVVAGTGRIGVANANIFWSASSSIKDGVSGVTDQRISTNWDPDSDSDGIIDAADNCPTVANPNQADCNNNGIGEACEVFTDCNYTGLPDSCDIAAGSSLDGDTNGVPDECQADCNLNQISDLQEINNGSVPDGNADRVPDTCQGAIFVNSDSGILGAPSGFEARSFTFTSALYAESTVTVTIDARGDLNGTTEFVDVDLNGGAAQRFFQATGNSCPTTPDRATITLTRQQYATLLTAAADSLTVTMNCPLTVDPTECKGTGMTQFKVSYLGINPATGDCNHNNRLDIYEIHEGLVPDCNRNNVPDSCDLGRGGIADCDLDGIADICEIGTTPSLDCNLNSQLDSCELAAGGITIDCDQNGRIDSCQVAEIAGIDCNGNLTPDSCDVAGGISADIDANGKPDECQTVQVPAQYATIQSAIDSAPTNEMRIVMVGAGIFPGPIDFQGKPVRVHGTSCAQTIINGNGNQTASVVRFSGGEPAIAVLECVTVRGGTSGTQPIGSPTVLAGGGIFGQNSAASVRNCFVVNNTSGFGGGAYFLNCTGSVTNTVFGGNTASSDGGGFQANQSTMTLTDVLIENNTCNSRGGGMHLVQGNPTLTRVTVRNNVASNLIGGISWYATGSSTAHLAMNTCTITGNTSFVTQGGIGISETSTLPPSASLVATTVCDNLPRPNITGRWEDLGSNNVCDCLGDLNLDGVVNGADIALLLSVANTTTGCGNNCSADLNGDGLVNGADIGLMLSAWGACGG
jgi:hypothetical protein